MARRFRRSLRIGRLASAIAVALGGAGPACEGGDAPATASGRAASEQIEFLVERFSGFGLIDCFDGRHACGPLVAESLCQSRGFARVISVRPARETGAGERPRDGAPIAVYIACAALRAGKA